MLPCRRSSRPAWPGNASRGGHEWSGTCVLASTGHGRTSSAALASAGFRNRDRGHCVKQPKRGGKARSKLDAEDRDKVPNREFAFPKQRKEPLEDASHVRNAVVRFDQVEDVTDAERDEAWKRIEAAARQFGVALHERSWRELGKLPPKR